MATVLALIIAAMAAATVVMGLRLSGALRERDKAVLSAQRAVDTSITVAEEFKLHRERKRAQIRGLMEDIEALGDDLENCTTPGSKRARLRSLVSKAKAASNDHA